MQAGTTLTRIRARAGLNQGVITASLRQAVAVASTASAGSPFSAAAAATIALATFRGPGGVARLAYLVCAVTCPAIAAYADSLFADAPDSGQLPHDALAGIAHAANVTPTSAQPAVAVPCAHAPIANAGIPQPTGAQPAVTITFARAPILSIPASPGPAHAVCSCPHPVTRPAPRPPHRRS